MWHAIWRRSGHGGMPGSPWHTLCGRAADHSERRSWGLPLEEDAPAADVIAWVRPVVDVALSARS